MLVVMRLIVLIPKTATDFSDVLSELLLILVWVAMNK